MKLFYSTSSPYARKARVIAREKGLLDRVTETECHAAAPPPDLVAANPLLKIPTLVLDGMSLFDSPVICEYLDNLNEEPVLLPRGGDARWQVLRAEALADGLLDVAVALMLEDRRPAGERSATVGAKLEKEIRSVLAAMPDQLEALPQTVSLGHITIAIALEYLDFRLSRLAWRDGNAGLAVWLEGFAARAALQQTTFSDASARLIQAAR